MGDQERNQRFVAEKLRLVCKGIGWALQNLQQIYEAVRPAEMEPIKDDPNQLKMPFDD